jgi:Subtilase family
VFGSRSAQQRRNAAGTKLDSILADLSRHAARARPDHWLADLHSMSPAARFVQRGAAEMPLVLIDAITRGDPQRLRSTLVSLGLEHAAQYANDVGGWLPVNQIEAAAARAEVLSIRAAMPHTRAAGPVATQGDYAQRSDVVRSTYPSLTGTGITVGVLSDSFNCYAVYAAAGSGVPVSGNEGYAYNGFTADYATDISTGALPSGVTVLAEPYTPAGPSPTGNCLDYGAPTQTPFTDEGRAMMQIVHVVAPGASLAFYTGDNSEADFANGIGALAAAGAQVIVDDLGYYDEPFFQDGIVAQAIDAVEANGTAYFSAAGNDGGTPSYQNLSPVFNTIQGSGEQIGEALLNFDTSGATTTAYLPITVPAIPPGDFLAVVVEWDQPYVTGCTATPSTLCTGAVSQIDVCITGGTGSDTITDYDGNTTSCSGPSPVGTDPYQVMIIGNPANAAGNSAQQNLNIVVGLANSTQQPGRILVAVEDDGLGSTITQFANNGPTLQGHPGAAGAAAVGAAFYFYTPRCGTTPPQLESFSSSGGAPILFSTAGARLATPVVRQKPDFVAPNGVNDTFLGFTLASEGITANTTITECENNPNYPNFFGTSAAGPHAAGIAALMLQANSTATPTQIYTALRTSALPMTGSGATPNLNSGYGFIQADAALALIPPGAPTLTLGAASIAPGASTTITWSSVNATSCTASGSWTGTLAASGSQTITPAGAGSETFTLTCTNAGGTSAAASETLAVGVPPAAPTLTLGAASVVFGNSTTITWSSVNATGCTASGNWSGTLATSGSQTLTPTTIGADSYSLTCANAAGNSPAAAVNLTVNGIPTAVPPTSGGGGGGALGGLSLLGLAGLTGARSLRRRIKAG